jgi:VWFA-related protein
MAIAVGEPTHARLSVLRRLAILLLPTFAPWGLRAQAAHAPAPQPPQTSEPTFKLQVRKNEVVVRVVVRDSHGRVVAGLRQEDFKITDDRKPQAITSFSFEGHPEEIPSPALPPAVTPAESAEKQKEAAALAAPTAYLGLYFDDLSLAPGSVARVREAAEKFVAGVPASERIAIFTCTGNPSLDFTDDRQKLHEALLKLRVNQRLAPRASCPEITDFLADRIVNFEDPNAFRIVRDEAINDCYMDPRTVKDPQIRVWGHQAYDAFLTQARAVMASLEGAVQHLAGMPGERQLMLVSDGFMTFDIHDRLERVIDEALHRRVIISSLDGKGLAVNLREGDASRKNALTGNLASLYQMYDTSREAAATDALAEVADATGGQFVHNTNDLLGGLRTALQAPEAAYVLAFSPEKLEPNGTYHTLKVSLVHGRGFSLQARKGYFAPSKQTSPEEQAKNDVREAILNPAPIQELPMEVQAQGRIIAPQKAEIRVLARLDVRALSFSREGDRNINKVVFTLALFDANGKFVSGKQEERNLALLDNTLADLQKSGLDFQTDLPVTPGVYTVRVVARDSRNGAMAALSKPVEIPQ